MSPSRARWGFPGPWAETVPQDAWAGSSVCASDETAVLLRLGLLGESGLYI